MESVKGKPRTGARGKSRQKALKEMGNHETDLPANFELQLFVTKGSAFREIQYSEVGCNVIAGLIAQGMTMSAISRLPGMPTVLDMQRWMQKEPEFKKLMDLAEKAKAEVLADAALQVADKSIWNTAAADRIKVDTALKLAGVYHPDKFGNKTHIKSEHHESLTFYINTGFEHPGESRRLKPIEIETRDPAQVLKEENEAQKDKDVESKSEDILIQDQ